MEGTHASTKHAATSFNASNNPSIPHDTLLQHHSMPQTIHPSHMTLCCAEHSLHSEAHSECHQIMSHEHAKQPRHQAGASWDAQGKECSAVCAFLVSAAHSSARVQTQGRRTNWVCTPCTPSSMHAHTRTGCGRGCACADVEKVVKCQAH
mgnify:CR=1 FL=1